MGAANDLLRPALFVRRRLLPFILHEVQRAFQFDLQLRALWQLQFVSSASFHKYAASAASAAPSTASFAFLCLIIHAARPFRPLLLPLLPRLSGVLVFPSISPSFSGLDLTL